MRRAGKHFAITLLVSFLIAEDAFACRPLYDALNATNSADRSVALTKAYRAWIDATPFTEHELTALVADPLVLPDIEGGRSEVRALVKLIATIHDRLPPADRVAWADQARAMAREKLGREHEIGTIRDTVRQTTRTAVRPLGQWKIGDVSFEAISVLPDGRVLTPDGIVDMRATPPSIQGIEDMRVTPSSLQAFPSRNTAAMTSGKFSFGAREGRWYDLTTGLALEKSPIAPAAFPTGLKNGDTLENVRFHHGDRWATFELNVHEPSSQGSHRRSAYRYDLKTPGANRELLDGVERAHSLSSDGAHVLGTRVVGSARELVISSAVGSAARVVAPDIYELLSSAPAADGKHFFAIVEMDRLPRYSLWKIDAASAQLVEDRPLDGTRHAVQFGLSPDGSVLARARRGQGGSDGLLLSTTTLSPIAAARWKLPRARFVALDSQSKYVLVHTSDGDSNKLMLYDFKEWLRMGFAGETP